MTLGASLVKLLRKFVLNQVALVCLQKEEREREREIVGWMDGFVMHYLHIHICVL